MAGSEREDPPQWQVSGVAGGLSTVRWHRGSWAPFSLPEVLGEALVLLEEKLGGGPGSWNTGVAARALRSGSRKGQQPSPSRFLSFCRLRVEGASEGIAS